MLLVKLGLGFLSSLISSTSLADSINVVKDTSSKWRNSTTYTIHMSRFSSALKSRQSGGFIPSP